MTYNAIPSSMRALSLILFERESWRSKHPLGSESFFEVAKKANSFPCYLRRACQIEFFLPSPHYAEKIQLKQFSNFLKVR
jgi:hypothetical protein